MGKSDRTMTLKEAVGLIRRNSKPAAVCPVCGKNLTDAARVADSESVYGHHLWLHYRDAFAVIMETVGRLSDDQLDSLESLRGRR